METIKTNIYSKWLGLVLLSFFLFPSFSQAVTAEYKCTGECTLCLLYTKKTVCSEKYGEESEEFTQVRRLTKFINEGLVVPDENLKPGFKLDVFTEKYFDCQAMTIKAKQIVEATRSMCSNKPKVSSRKPLSTTRAPASVAPSRVKSKKIKKTEDLNALEAEMEPSEEE